MGIQAGVIAQSVQVDDHPARLAGGPANSPEEPEPPGAGESPFGLDSLASGTAGRFGTSHSHSRCSGIPFPQPPAGLSRGSYVDSPSYDTAARPSRRLKDAIKHTAEDRAIQKTTETENEAIDSALSGNSKAAARQHLIVSYGVDAARLTAKGLGAAKPAASNDTAEGRQQNRRVELVKM
jgi:hypothetical protein